MPYLRCAISNRPIDGQTYRTVGVPFETDRRKKHAENEIYGLKHTDWYAEHQMCRLKQTDWQTFRSSDVPFDTDRKTDRQAEHQKCPLKQADRQTDMPNIRCPVWKRRASDMALETDGEIDMTNLGYAVWNRLTDRQTDMPIRRCAVSNRRTGTQTSRSKHVPIQTDGQRDRKHDQPHMFRFKQTDIQADIAKLRYSIWNRRNDRQTDKPKLRCTVWNRRTDIPKHWYVFSNRGADRQTCRNTDMPF